MKQEVNSEGIYDRGGLLLEEVYCGSRPGVLGSSNSSQVREGEAKERETTHEKSVNSF